MGKKKSKNKCKKVTIDYDKIKEIVTTIIDEKIECRKSIENEEIREVVKSVVNEKTIQKQKAESDNFREYGLNLIPANRIEKKDLKFFSSKSINIENKVFYRIVGNNFINHLFIRAIAKTIIFENVDFSQTIFDNCYLRDCRFIRCNFVGAKFMNSNLQGSYFEDCNFDFVIFEKTFVDDEIFECAPKRNNLKYKFARSLKLNYASIGDYIKASNAVEIELEATKKHLYDTWTLNDDYHRNKYGGIRKRFRQFCKWIEVSLLDFVWGNGENWMRLVKANFCIFSFLSIWDVVSNYTEYRSREFLSSVYHYLSVLFIKIPSNYFGIKVHKEELINNVATSIDYFSYYPEWLSLLLVILRMICFGLLMSIIIKKYNRR